MKTLLFACFTIAAVACATTYPSPTGRLVQSEASLRAAQEVGAQNDPQAALHAKLAAEQISQAKTQMAHGENERAEYLLVRAKADADLAVMLAKEAQAKTDAQQAQYQADQLRQSAGQR